MNNEPIDILQIANQRYEHAMRRVLSCCYSGTCARIAAIERQAASDDLNAAQKFVLQMLDG